MLSLTPQKDGSETIHYFTNKTDILSKSLLQISFAVKLSDRAGILILMPTEWLKNVIL